MTKKIVILIKRFLPPLLLGIFLVFSLIPLTESTNFFISTISTILGGILISLVFYLLFFRIFRGTEKNELRLKHIERLHREGFGGQK